MISTGSFIDILLNGNHFSDIWTPPKITLNKELQLLEYCKSNFHLITSNRTSFNLRNIKKIEIESRLFGFDLTISTLNSKVTVRCLKIRSTILIVEEIKKLSIVLPN